MVCAIDLPGPRGKDAESDKGETPPSRRLFVIDLQNTPGGLFGWLTGIDISSTQYERDTSFSFGDSARIVEVVEEHPPDLGAEVSIGGSHKEKVVLTPLLLNRDDWFRLKVVVANPTNRVSAEGRILGIKELRRRWSAGQLLIYGFSLAFLAALVIDYLPRQVGWFLTGDQLWMLQLPEIYAAWNGVILAGLATALAMIIRGLRRAKRSQQVCEEVRFSYSVGE